MFLPGFFWPAITHGKISREDRNIDININMDTTAGMWGWGWMKIIFFQLGERFKFCQYNLLNALKFVCEFVSIFFSISSPTFWSFLYVYCAQDYRNINGRWVRAHNEVFREVMTRERLWAGDCSWWCPGYCAWPAPSLVHGVNGALITRGPRCHHSATMEKWEGHCILGQCSPLRTY